MTKKKNNKPRDMILFSCEKWDKKCQSVQPCQMIAPISCKKIVGCPRNRNSGIWKRVPTTRLTV